MTQLVPPVPLSANPRIWILVLALAFSPLWAQAESSPLQKRIRTEMKDPELDEKDGEYDDGYEDSGSDDDESMESIRRRRRKDGNLRISALGLIILQLYVNAEFKVAPFLTIGPDLYYRFNAESPGYQGGVRANFYFNSNTLASNYYISPAVGYYNFNTSGLAISSTTGYQFIGYRGFSVAGGAGAVYTMPSEGDSQVRPVLELFVGYAW